ncbi:MAG: 30S ribosomal protein S17 [Candidatus Endonucleobacter sp. (ex Gigantidas childressi)]|nr:30S ribosomal protein S17 [Candidatus Endonucleobacter sp. (ex Gigantidas childressi)]
MVENKKIRTLSGKVVSNKMNKTVTVLIERRVTHKLYAKIIKRSTKLHAHDESNDCRIGDTVTITATRPLSKSKAFVLVSIDERAAQL